MRIRYTPDRSFRSLVRAYKENGFPEHHRQIRASLKAKSPPEAYRWIDHLCDKGRLSELLTCIGQAVDEATTHERIRLRAQAWEDETKGDDDDDGGDDEGPGTGFKP